MDAQTIALLIAGGGALSVVVWLLAKLGKALVTIAEALAAAAVVFLAAWLMIKAVLWLFRQTLRYWRTSVTVVALLAWWQWWGWASLATTAGVLAGMLAGWRLVSLRSFDAWAGRYLRGWWLRWTVYAPKLPDWLHACGLGIKQDAAPVVIALTPLGRTLGRRRRPVPALAAQSAGSALRRIVGRGPGTADSRPETRGCRGGHPRVGLGPRRGPLPGPGTVPERGLDRFPATQSARRPGELPRAHHAEQRRGRSD